MRSLCPSIGKRTLIFPALCTALLFLLAHGRSHAQAFSLNTTASLSTAINGTLAWGDYDVDGDPDVLVSGLAVATTVYRNDGGTYTDIGANLFYGFVACDAAWGDYDADGDLDILLAGNWGGGGGFHSRIYRNNAGNFSDIGAGLEGVENAAVAWGDYDNDGDLDVLLAGSNGVAHITRLYRNDGGSFTNISHNMTGVTEGDVAFGDYDNDGDLDIILTGRVLPSGNVTQIYRNDGGTFTDINAGLQGVYDSSVSWGDYDNDGDLDILVTGMPMANAKIYRNDHGTFVDINASLQGVGEGMAAWGDYDNDGDLDILLSGRGFGDVIANNVYRNDAGSFTNINAGLPQVFDTHLAWADNDNDGDLDILFSGYNGGFVPAQIWTNNTSTANTAPTAPTGLAASDFKISTARLSWNRASDAQTPQLGLSYNLVVGTTTADISVQSPMASVMTGKRRIAALGSENNTTSTVLSGLVSGTTYYWSVQAIDAGYVGSLFATSGSFTFVPAFEQAVATGLPNVAYGSVEWGDYDNDGDLDALITGQDSVSSDQTGIYQNNGGSFTDIGAGLPGVNDGSATWVDYDSDGDLDIFLTGYQYDAAANISAVYRNDGGGVFTDINAGLVPMYASAGLWSDYDNDGDPDLLLSGRDGGGNGSNYVYRNDGGVFTDINAGLAGITGVGAWGDYDNDGDPDILLSGMDNGASRYSIVYRNDGGVFTDINAGLPGTSNSTAVWGDYDSDGDLDILLAGYDGIDLLTNIYRNDGGTFTDINAGLVPLQYASAAWGDYDNDGDFDLVFSGQDANLERKTLVYENKVNTAEGFVSMESGLFAVSHGSATWGDYDNDGDLDLVLSGEADVPDNLALQLWVNNTTHANTVPAVPTGLRIADITMTGVELAWNRAADAETPQIALSYNVAIWTTTASVQSPMAQVTTGYRQVVALGNEPMTTSTLIEGLIPGETYYWSVQAIDGAYAGSAFAPIDSFVYQPLLANTGDAGLPAVENGDLAWGDYDNDGDLDLAIAGSDGTQHISRIYRNDAGSFTDINAGLAGVAESTVIWGDYDNDGDLDIALSGRLFPSNTKTARIYRNDNGTFVDINAGLPGIYWGTMAWGDYDNDGDLDLVMTGEDSVSNYPVFLYRNDAGSFTNVSTTGLDGGAISSAAWGDYDNDGDLDLLLSVSNGTGDYLDIYRNDRGTFSAISANLTVMIGGSVAWGDYDADGDLDILTTGSDYSLIYRNDAGIFTDINAGLAPSISGFGAWGDYDNDGDLDILLAGYSGPAMGYIYTNTGGSFSPVPRTPVLSSAEAWGDYDADGDLDFVLTGTDSTHALITQVWKNNSIKHLNTPPTAPVLNTPESGLESMQLSWSRATDNETPQLGLSYNLVIGTTTSSISIESPMANVTTGYRRVVAIGPQQITSANIYGLVEGQRYYWSVQAIDGAFAGSAFATTGSFVYQPPFRQVTTAGLEGLENCTVAWGDYDNDGDLDLFMAGSNGSAHVSRIYRNDGGANFTDINAGLPGVSEAGAAWGDYDNDGDLDLAFGGRLYPSNADYNFIYRNDNGVFTSLGNFLTGGRYSSFSWGDYDNDGDLDLLLSANQTGVEFTNLYRNDNGSFTGLNISSMVEWAALGDVTWGDYDNDGDQDILQTGYSINNYYVSRVYRNDGGTFTNINAGLTGVSDASSAWGDYDSDGDLDIVLTGDMGPAYITRVYRNDGGVFTNINADLAGASEGSVAWGDYDNDGDLDILFTGSSSLSAFTYVYRNDGGNFKLAVELPEVDRSAAAWGDYDNDGDLDFVMSGNQYISSSFIAQLWENLSTRANTTPSAPTGLAVSNSNLDAVRLSWNRATDNETPQLGLSYNLMIGTTSTINVQSPMADVTTGYRRVVALGSEQHTTATVIKGLVPGQTYYWGVQAVDGAFAGSTFATSSFVYRPTLTLSTTASLPGLQRGIAKWGDYDADGDMDLLLAGETATSAIFRVYRNDAGSFTDINAGFPGLTDPDAAWGDYDNDGDLDLMLTGQDGGARINAVYRNDGGSFTNINADFRLLGITGLIQASVEWGDVDNDGQLDILINGWSPGQITGSFIFRNDNGNFSYAPPYYIGGVDGSASFADYDNDGDLDFVFAGSGNRGLYNNNSHGGFALVVFGSATASTATWGDYDNDGDPDLLYTGANSFIMRNGGGIVGEAGFANPGFSFPGVSEGSGEWGDIDNDGDLDILLTGNNGGTRITRIYRNDGAGFTDIGGPLPGVSGGGGRWGDYDNDGDLDLVLTGVDNSSNPVTQVWVNNLAATGNTNDAPSAPTGLALVASDPYGVALRWSPASDVETPQAGLTYNMYIGTSATVSEQTPMASITTGVRYVPERGGEQQVTFATLRNLKGNTTYYWGVQAIDAGYKGSTFATSSFYYNPPFQSVVAMGGLVRGEVVWGDFDDDNDLDFIMSGSNGSADEVRVMRNNDGTSNITGVSAGIAGVSYSSLAFGDYNNDNRIDLLVSGISNHTPISRIYYNNGGGGFVDISAGLEGVYESSAAWADYDNDGDLDFVISGYVSGGSSVSKIYRNDAGNFTDINAGLTGVAKSSVAWGDYDNDGDPDLLIAGSEDPSPASTRIYRNDAGNFTDIHAGLAGVQESSVSWGDYDADGDLDILLVGADSVDHMRISRVYRNNGGTFTNANAALTGVAKGSAAWGDYDNDGDLDILLTGVDDYGDFLTAVYRNDGGNNFYKIDAHLPQVGHGSAVWGDYDKDGVLDILMNGEFQNIGYFWEIWKNMSTTANTVPNAPTGLTVSLGATSATLLWNKATDGQTPQAGLSYNLYIGTVNPGSDKQSPMADMTNGYRRVPAMGMERQTTSAVITGLTPGITYYWGVQAIDGAFAGSEFAIGDTIHINVPPEISVTQATISALEDVPHQLLASVFDFDHAPSQLIVTATSSNQSVLPDANLVMQGVTAATTEFLATPVLNTSGTAVVTITVTDPKGATATTSLTITFEHVNDAPFFTAGSDLLVRDDAGLQTVATWATVIGTGGGFDEAGQALQFILTSDRPDLFAVQPAISSNGTLTFTPAPLVFGLRDTAVVSVYLKDNGGTANGGVDTTSITTFTVILVSPNEAPLFTTGATVIAYDEDGLRVLPNFLTAISPGSSNESYQNVEFHVSNSKPGVFTQQPYITPTGDLIFTPRSGSTATVTVSVYATDDGGTEDGGVDMSTTQTFRINLGLTPVTRLVTSVYPSSQVQSGQELLFTVRPTTPKGTLRSTTATTPISLQSSAPYLHFVLEYDDNLPANVPPQQAHGVILAIFYNSSTANITVPITVFDVNGVLASTTAMVTINHAVPSALRVVTTNNRSVSLAWTPPVAQYIGGYAILRGTTTSSLAEIGTSLTTSYTDSTAENGQTYYYGVKSYSEALTDPMLTEVNFRSGMSSLVSATVPKIIVTTPNGSEIWDAATWHEIHWNTITTIATVGIEYSSDNGATWKPVVSATPNYGVYNWFVPSPGTTQAIVRVYDAARPLVRGTSNTFTVVPIPIVTGLTASALVDAVQLQWNPLILSTIPGVSTYLLYQRIGSSSSTRMLFGSSYASDPTSYIDLGLEDGQTRYYSIRANVAGELSDFSAEVAITPNNVQVLSPQGGEVYQPGTVQTIIWRYGGDITAVALEYSVDNGQTWIPISQTVTSAGNKPPTTFYHEWTVPNTPTTTAIVRVVSLSPVSTSRQSWPFTISTLVPATDLVATAGAASIELEWNASTAATVTGYRVLRGTTTASLSAIAALGAVTSYEDTSANACAKYYYAVQTLAGNAASANSNVASATILLPESITVTSPNGGEVWQVGTAHLITWTSTSCTIPASVTIEYSKNNGGDWTTIATAANTGSYAWTPLDSSSDEVLIRISGGAASDVSNTVFRVAPVSAPANLVAVAGSQDIALTWTASTGQNVSGYEVWRGSTSGSLSLLASVVMTSTYTDNTANACEAYYYAVKATVGANISAFSNETSATIALPGSITLITPNGGEVWQAGTTQLVAWTSTGCTVPAMVTIEYSIDNGANWNVIATTANTGNAFAWTLGNTPTTQARVRITGDALTDVSNAVFTIAPIPAPSNLAATAGSSTVGLAWTASTAQSLSGYEVWRGSTSGSLSLLATSTTNSYTDNSVTNCSAYVYAVRATVGAFTSTFSNEATAAPAITPAITVTSPNGGEVWHGGQAQIITWTSTACSVPSNVVLEYSTNNGGSWTTIATVVNSGSYNWTIPNTATVEGRVRVSGGAVNDMSDAAFTILPTPVPVLTAVQASVTTSSCSGTASSVMVSITLSDPIYSVGSLMLTATSSNQSVVSNSSIVRQGATSATTTFLVTANATTSGVSVLTFTASNGFAVGSTTVTFTSTVNALPVVTLSGSTSACAGAVGSYSIPTTSGGYHWTVAGGTIVSGQNTREISVQWGTAGSGSVAVVATSASACEASAVMNVAINPLPVVTVAASGVTTFCPGSSVVLTASPAGMNYLWNNGATGQSITVSASGTFSVTVTNQFGCSTVSTTTTVTVYPGVTVDAGTDVSVCQGTDVQLQAAVTSPVGGITYSWTPTTGLNSASIGNPIAAPSATTTYTVVVRDANGCESSDQVTVTVVPASATAVSSNATICAGSSTQLEATGGVSYVWSPAAGLSSTTTAVVTASPSTTTTYTVEIETAGGCVVSRIVTVTVAPVATADAGLDITLCAGSNAQLAATGGVSYEWSPSTGLNNPFIANPVASPSTTTTYTVLVRTAAGCESTDDVTVMVLPLVVDLHVQLEGAYAGTEMSTSLHTQGLVPTNQPYNVAPFNYAGTEQMTTTSTAVVDWVLVEVRSGEASNTMVARKAALLLSDGSIVEGDGSALSISGVTSAGSYYIVLHHRNHLGIMSSVSVSANSTCAVNYNFAGSATAAYEAFMPPQKELSAGVWGMVAGDADANGIVNAVDRVIVRNAVGHLGYENADLSLDGIVNAADRVISRNNVFRTSQLP